MHLVEIGGELVGRGFRPDGDPWWVDIDVPLGLDLAPIRVALHEIAIATSGSYVRGNHNLDPRTGRPCLGAVSCTVIADTAMTADALASAALVSFPNVEWLEEDDVAARMVVQRSNRAEELLTRSFAAMLAE